MTLRKLICLFVLLIAACKTPTPSYSSNLQGRARCEDIAAKIDWSNQIETLNMISDFYHSECFEHTIKMGTKAKDQFRHKNYSITKEVFELFIPEGSVTEYVLESYERGYLTFLIAASYLHLNQEAALTVELNQFYNEEKALLYNHGQDPVNTLLQAAMWDNFPREGFSSRPFWLRISQSKDFGDEVRKFAQNRITALDAKEPAIKWRIAEVGKFPATAWSIKFTSETEGYFKIQPKPSFGEECVGRKELVIPTNSWFRKIATRHANTYHPLVNAKAWIRLPFGMVYGLATLTAGAGIAVGGCAIDAGIKADGDLCILSVHGGVALMRHSDDVIDFALQPDLRHWENIPAALWLQADDGTSKSTCGVTASTRRIL